MESNKKYDVGIVGWWSNLNYGGTLTYYMLNKALEEMGYSVLMIKKSNQTDESTVPFRFSKKHYNISETYNFEGLKKLNDICDAFIAGSDQLWNPNLLTWSGPEFYLSFVDTNKKKISYATSFGNIDYCDNEFIDKYGLYLDDFDAISVREDYAVDLCRKYFGLNSVQICDSIFLCEKDKLETLVEDSQIEVPSEYMLSFLLDPDDTKLKVCDDVRSRLNIKDDLYFTDLQGVEERKKVLNGRNAILNGEIEDIIKAYMNASFVVTDSFHGTCLAILFNKPFISLANYQRGQRRFESLLKWVGLSDRLFFDYNDAIKGNKIFEHIDYESVNKIINESRNFAREWLRKALDTEELSSDKKILKTKVSAAFNNPDFKKIKTLATLLRDYGVKHVVMSPGGRDVPLVRIFENNQDSFTLHRIVDERSAAYYGLGIAAQLQEPVACVCTSGTAVSNYMPAVTEAYYTGVPLIMITADRYMVYHNQGEDQTIEQSHIFRDVTKMEITVPEGIGDNVDYQTRRDISACILECTHNGFGPVHINIAIGDIMIGSGLKRRYWKLNNRIYPHIMRTGVKYPEENLMRWVNDLKKSQKILVVYGQNPPLNEHELRMIERFANSYNCVIATDFLSNLNCDYSIKAFNMLNRISQKTFNEKLLPDILITVGGKRLMNDPLTFKIRGGWGSVRHWSVTPNGEVKDFYFRLSSILEMTQEQFFEFFAKNARDCKNNGEYFNEWKMLNDANDVAPDIKDFNAHYIQSKFIPNIPEDSILHLGVGQSFFDCRRYSMKNNVSVFCNMGTNGIDGCTSTFMGQCSVEKDKLCFLIVGDLSFFYDMNSVWNKELSSNIRILMVNNSGSGLLKGHNLRGIHSPHSASAKGWVENCGFKYITANNPEDYEKQLEWFLSEEPDSAVFFEVFCN